MKSTSFLRAAAVAACVCAAGAAPAQQAPVPQPPQVTPRDLRPETKPTPPAALPRSAPETAPAQAESLFVTATTIALDGSFDELAPASQALLPPLVGQRRSVADFYRLNNDSLDAPPDELVEKIAAIRTGGNRSAWW